MDGDRFSSRSPGRLVPIEGGEMAFVPAPAPEGLELSGALWPLMAEANQWIGRLRGLGESRVLSDPAVLIRPLTVLESMRSTTLEEGPVDEAAALRGEHAPGGVGAGQEGPEREAMNLARAIEQGEALVDSRGFSLWLIRSIHQTLLDGARGSRKHPGEFRNRQVFIGADHRFVPPPAHLLGECLEAFERAMRAKPKAPSLVWCFVLHYQFEAIHPFLDGNGRVGRALLAMMLASWTELRRPWLFLSPFFERHRREYFDGLLRVSVEGDWDSWLGFCLRGVAEEGAATTRRLSRLLDLWKRWTDTARRHNLKARTTALFEALLANPVISPTRAAAVMDCAYNTARADIDRLIELGILRPESGEQPRSARAHEVFEIVFGDG